jgi:hypothetical protein
MPLENFETAFRLRGIFDKSIAEQFTRMQSYFIFKVKYTYKFRSRKMNFLKKFRIIPIYKFQFNNGHYLPAKTFFNNGLENNMVNTFIVQGVFNITSVIRFVSGYHILYNKDTYFREKDYLRQYFVSEFNIAWTASAGGGKKPVFIRIGVMYEYYNRFNDELKLFGALNKNSWKFFARAYIQL